MPRRQLSPPRLLATGLAGVILVGTLVLVTPLASASGVSIGWSAAFFTATSAVCVTGLVVVDTPTAFSGFGQAVILVLIQIGGLGYMTLATFIALIIGRRVSMNDQASLQESLNLDSRKDVTRFALTVVKVTLAFEAVGALILWVRWWPQFGAGDAAWLGMFHSVSAFNNAGFSLFSYSLMDWSSDLVITLTIMALIIAGGIGYLVLADVFRWRRHRALSMHSRFVLAVSASLIVLGAAGVYLVERGNPDTLGGISRSEAALAAVFQSVTARTAGFNSIDIAALTPPAFLFLLVLMFIGGGPGGTAGGIKVTTFGVTVMALWATVRGMREPHVLKRRIPGDVVARAFLSASSRSCR